MGRAELTAQRTRATVLHYIDSLNAHDADRIADCVTADFVNEHTSVLGHSRRGRAEYRAALEQFLAGFADLHYEVEDVVAEGDRAALAYRMSFRRDGRSVTVRGVFRFVVDDAGLIAHRVDYWDSAAVNT